MHRCFVRPADWNGPEIRLSRTEEHHLRHVLHAGEGDTVAVFDGRGREALASVVVERGRRAVLKLLAEPRIVQPALCRLTLMQALPKGRKMDLIVEKATELGVSTIVPVISERVVTRLKERRGKDRVERWQRIALSAARQSGSGWIPEVRPVSGYADAMTGCGSFDLFLVGSLGNDTYPFRSVTERARKKKPRKIGLLIGPEGDLTPAEIRKAVEAGAVPVSFGPLVFRVETAALYSLSVLAYEFLG